MKQGKRKGQTGKKQRGERGKKRRNKSDKRKRSWGRKMRKWEKGRKEWAIGRKIFNFVAPPVPAPPLPSRTEPKGREQERRKETAAGNGNRANRKRCAGIIYWEWRNHSIRLGTLDGKRTENQRRMRDKWGDILSGR